MVSYGLEVHCCAAPLAEVAFRSGIARGGFNIAATGVYTIAGAGLTACHVALADMAYKLIEAARAKGVTLNFVTARAFIRAQPGGSWLADNN